MKNELVVIDAPELKLIEESKANKIKETFEPMAEMLAEFENAFNEIIKESKKEITGELSAKAKRLRLDIGKVRIETGKLKDKQKIKIKLEDKAIMGVHNILVWAVAEKEDLLKEIENFAEIKEQNRLEKLQSDRMGELEAYGVEFIPDNLSSMDDNVWVNYLSGIKLAHDQRMEAEKKAKAEIIEKEAAEKLYYERLNLISPYSDFDQIFELTTSTTVNEFNKLLTGLVDQKSLYDSEQEKIREDNERLKKEADLKEKKRLEDEKLLKAKAEKEKQEREAKEAKTKAENEAKLKIEREKREKIEAELKAKAEKEKQDAIAKEHLIQLELKKGDNAKIQDLKAGLIALKTKYSFKAKKNQIKLSKVCILIDKVVVFIDE